MNFERGTDPGRSRLVSLRKNSFGFHSECHCVSYQRTFLVELMQVPEFLSLFFKCRSFNFCGRQRCELNTHDVFSIGVSNQHLLESIKSCVYFGMDQNYIPVCQRSGKMMSANFTNGNGSLDACSILAKRVDREWSSWISYSNRTGDDYFEYKTREILVDSAHGGSSGSDESWQLLKHLRIVLHGSDWFSARMQCEQFKGRLFCDLDGTVDQLQFLRELVKHCWLWVGIRRTDNGYETVNGIMINDRKIIWAPGQPNEAFGPLGLTDLERSSLSVGGYNYRLCFICDMM